MPRLFLALLVFSLFTMPAMAQEERTSKSEELLARAEKEFSSGDITRAKQTFSLAEQSARDSYGDDSLEFAAALNLYAGALCSTKDFSKGIPKFEAAAAIRRTKLSETNRDYAVVLNNLGFCQLQAEAYEDAFRELEKARSIVSELKPSEPILLSLIHSNLGETNYKRGKQKEAERNFTQAISLLKSEVSDDDPMLGTAYNNLAYVSIALGKSHEAISLYESALKILEKQYGKNNPQVAHTLHNLAEAYRESGDEKRAETFLKRAIEIRSAAKAGELPVSLTSLGELYLSTKREKDALPLLIRAKSLLEAKDSSTEDLQPVLDTLALAYIKTGHYPEAESIYRNSSNTYSTRRNLAFVLLKQKKYPQSESIYKTLLNELEKDPAEHLDEQVSLLNDLAQIAKDKNQTEQAIDFLLQATKLLVSGGPSREPELVNYLSEISALEESRGSTAGALRTAKTALALARKTYGPKASETTLLARRVLQLSTPGRAPGTKKRKN